MARVALDLGDKKDLQLVGTTGWRVAPDWCRENLTRGWWPS